MCASEATRVARDAEKLALELAPLDFQRDALREIALRDRADDARHFRRRVHQIVDERVDRRDGVLPRAGDLADAGALRDLSLLANRLADALELLREALVDFNELVELIRDLTVDTAHPARHSDRKVAFAQTGERVGELAFVEAGRQGDEGNHGDFGY